MYLQCVLWKLRKKIHGSTSSPFRFLSGTSKHFLPKALGRVSSLPPPQPNQGQHENKVFNILCQFNSVSLPTTEKTIQTRRITSKDGEFGSIVRQHGLHHCFHRVLSPSDGKQRTNDVMVFHLQASKSYTSVSKCILMYLDCNVRYAHLVAGGTHRQLPACRVRSRDEILQ